MKYYRIALIAAIIWFAFSGTQAKAQRFSVSTNVIDWVNLGTINGEAGIAIGQHFSIHANVRYNNWTFRKGSPEDRFTDPIGDGEKQFENRKQAYALGLRWWPWYIYSGWWVYARGIYMEYNWGGIIKHWAEEGDAYGAGLGFGYTHMLSKHWNIEFGAGAWAGQKKFTQYRCTNCGTVMDSGKKFFIMPDDVFVSFIYVF